MCVMALRLVLVFRPVSPLSGHSHAAGRRGSPTLFTNLGPVRHTSLELQSQKLFSLLTRRCIAAALLTYYLLLTTYYSL
jgi:hypothetical protein